MTNPLISKRIRALQLSKLSDPLKDLVESLDAAELDTERLRELVNIKADEQKLDSNVLAPLNLAISIAEISVDLVPLIDKANKDARRLPVP